MFIDASAIVAVLKSEPEATAFLTAMDSARQNIFTSQIARIEATTSLALSIAHGRGESVSNGADFEMAEDAVATLISEAGCRDIAITESVGRLAREAAHIYGAATDHPAQLTLPDCFAYACAKAYRLPILYTGKGFNHTDLA